MARSSLPPLYRTCPPSRGPFLKPASVQPSPVSASALNFRFNLNYYTSFLSLSSLASSNRHYLSRVAYRLLLSSTAVDLGRHRAGPCVPSHPKILHILIEIFLGSPVPLPPPADSINGVLLIGIFPCGPLPYSINIRGEPAALVDATVDPSVRTSSQSLYLSFPKLVIYQLIPLT